MRRRIAFAFAALALIALSVALTRASLAGGSRSIGPRTLSAAGLGPDRAANAQTANAKESLVLELPGNRWYEGAFERVVVSPNGKWALVTGGTPQKRIQLYSLKTRQEDARTLTADLNRVDFAMFCANGIARLGERTVEDGWFLPHEGGLKLSNVPEDANPICAGSDSEVAYFKANESAPEVFIDLGERVRSFGVSGRVVGMVFSPDGNYLYGLLFPHSGESSVIRIDVNTGASKVVASHLDASPQAGPISISPDGREIYLALATDGAPDNEARHQPDADRWLKIYALDLTTGARRRVVDSPGQDNSWPTIGGNDLYWTRTVYNDSIVLVPSTGGDAREIVSGGQLPMWSPDSKRIGYFFGGPRQADWGLNLDDAVVAIDEQGNRASQPAVIVSGYGEDFSPAWSPDGKWIAFHSHRSRKPVPQYGDPASTDDIYLRLADDIHAPEMRLTDFGWETGPAFWSPDGRKLLFSSWERGGQAEIDELFVLTLNPETGRVLATEKLPLPAEIRSVSWATWSPDGEQIAIEDNRSGEDRTLWTVRADGSHAEKVLDYKGTSYDGLDWMPEGKTIVYSALADGRMQLFVIPSFGGSPRQLTHDSANLFHPRVSPDGHWIACTRIAQSKQIWRRPLN